MTIIRKYRVHLVASMLLALWGYAGTVWVFGHEAGNVARLIALPFLVAGCVALATYFSE